MVMGPRLKRPPSHSSPTGLKEMADRGRTRSRGEAVCMNPVGLRRHKTELSSIRIP